MGVRFLMLVWVVLSGEILKNLTYKVLLWQKKAEAEE